MFRHCIIKQLLVSVLLTVFAVAALSSLSLSNLMKKNVQLVLLPSY